MPLAEEGTETAANKRAEAGDTLTLRNRCLFPEATFVTRKQVEIPGVSDADLVIYECSSVSS